MLIADIPTLSVDYFKIIDLWKSSKRKMRFQEQFFTPTILLLGKNILWKEKLLLQADEE